MFIRYTLIHINSLHSGLNEINRYKRAKETDFDGEFMVFLISKQVIQHHFNALYVYENK